jgi:hypothetical protein
VEAQTVTQEGAGRAGDSGQGQWPGEPPPGTKPPS